MYKLYEYTYSASETVIYNETKHGTHLWNIVLYIQKQLYSIIGYTKK